MQNQSSPLPKFQETDDIFREAAAFDICFDTISKEVPLLQQTARDVAKKAWDAALAYERSKTENWK